MRDLHPGLDAFDLQGVGPHALRKDRRGAPPENQENRTEERQNPHPHPHPRTAPHSDGMIIEAGTADETSPTRRDRKSGRAPRFSATTGFRRGRSPLGGSTATGPAGGGQKGAGSVTFTGFSMTSGSFKKPLPPNHPHPPLPQTSGTIKSPPSSRDRAADSGSARNGPGYRSTSPQQRRPETPVAPSATQETTNGAAGEQQEL